MSVGKCFKKMHPNQLDLYCSHRIGRCKSLRNTAPGDNLEAAKVHVAGRVCPICGAACDGETTLAT